MLKAIAVSMSSKCLRDCSFCYRNIVDDKPGDITSKLYSLCNRNETATVCWEYNGYNLHLSNNYIQNTQTMTTMPSVITEHLAAFLEKKVSAVALSYDREKCLWQNWVSAAILLKEKKIKVSCNFLLEPYWKFPLQILPYCDQVNLLCTKPTGELNESQKNQVQAIAMLIRSHKIPVATDNCLGVQLGNTECCNRESFIHILSDGTTESCSFKEKCFLYEIS